MMVGDAARPLRSCCAAGYEQYEVSAYARPDGSAPTI